MPAKKKETAPTPGEGLTYKGKPLLRRGNLIYYGNADDAYIVTLTVQETTRLIDLDIATNVLVQLQTNDVPGRERVVKHAERDGLFGALDLGEFWLTEILEEGE